MPGFDEIVGHDSIKEHFQRAMEQKKVSHAYILSGEDGMGKKMLARAFSLALLCEEGSGRACMHCHACRQVLSNNHPDLIEVTHEKAASIGVDDIREQIHDTISIMPYSGDYKIYIVDEAEKMTIQAQNAILKTIEEPPGYAVLMLLTANQETFLPTILSRCIQLKLKPLQDSVVRGYLTERLGVSVTQAEIYSAFARGNLGRAVSIASSENFQAMYQAVLQLLKKIHETDISEILDTIRRLKEEKADIQECLDFIEMWYRDVLVLKSTKDGDLLIFKEEYSAIEEEGRRSSYDKLGKIADAVTKTRMRLNANVNMELALELMLLVIKEGGREN